MFLISALRNFSGSSIFESELMESQSSRLVTGDPEPILDEPDLVQPILDETALDEPMDQDTPSSTKRTKMSLSKNTEKVRRVLKIKVFGEDSLLEMDDVTSSSKVQKQIVANSKNEEPKPRATVFRYCLIHS